MSIIDLSFHVFLVCAESPAGSRPKREEDSQSQYIMKDSVTIPSKLLGRKSPAPVRPAWKEATDKCAAFKPM